MICYWNVLVLHIDYFVICSIRKFGLFQAMKNQMFSFLAQLQGFRLKVNIHCQYTISFKIYKHVILLKKNLNCFFNKIIFVSDIDLYGFCPERDTFYTVVCETCHAIVKPQALIQHMGMSLYNSTLSVHIILLYIILLSIKDHSTYFNGTIVTVNVTVPEP